MRASKRVRNNIIIIRLFFFIIRHFRRRRRRRLCTQKIIFNRRLTKFTMSKCVLFFVCCGRSYLFGVLAECCCV